MSSFTVFITPLTAMFMCDYYVIRKQVIKLSDLYVNSPESIYWYQKGVNWRNMLCFLFGAAPGLPGLIHAANPKIHINSGINHFYQGSFVFQFVITFALYYIINTVFKPEVGQRDHVDYYHTFTEKELREWDMVPADDYNYPSIEFTNSSSKEVHYENPHADGSLQHLKMGYNETSKESMEES
ncbi:thiamine transporter thi7 [Kluyveromyces marxianus]|nr:thiamine transporter thi7 [Kluyveromyces marxianus]KAG0684367.1 thiamine transporter thi7 [Kluyveromyces marxianus]